MAPKYILQVKEFRLHSFGEGINGSLRQEDTWKRGGANLREKSFRTDDDLEVYDYLTGKFACRCALRFGEELLFLHSLLFLLQSPLL
jgi:hypothetical protein